MMLVFYTLYACVEGSEDVQQLTCAGGNAGCKTAKTGRALLQSKRATLKKMEQGEIEGRKRAASTIAATTPAPLNCGKDEWVFKVELKPDRFGQDITWKLKEWDFEGSVLEGGPYKNYGSVDEIEVSTEQVCISRNKGYVFSIEDSYDNAGMCCGDYGDGYYKLFVDGLPIKQGGEGFEPNPETTTLYPPETKPEPKELEPQPQPEPEPQPKDTTTDKPEAVNAEHGGHWVWEETIQVFPPGAPGPPGPPGPPGFQG